MKKFEINHSNLYEHKNNPQIYIPFSNEILDLGSPKIFATKLPGEDFESTEDDFNFNKFIEEIPYSRNPLYQKEIKDFEKDDISIYDYLYYNDLLETYFYYYLETFDINLIEISVIYASFNCGGYSEDEVLFFVKDEEKKISKLTKEEFNKKIIERIK